MGVTVTVTPGKQFARTEKVTNAKLNQLGQPTFAVTGTIGTSEITNGTVTADKTIAGAHFYTASVSYSNGIFTLTFSPAITITDGTIIAFKANTNGDPDVSGDLRLTIGASTKYLRKHRTAKPVKGDILANQIVECRYDTTMEAGAGGWQMLSQLGNPPDYYTAAATGTNAYALVLTPPSSYAFTLADIEGKRIRFEVPHTCTGACTVAVTIGGTVLTAKNLLKNFNQPLVDGDLRQYQIAEIAYEATSDAYQLLCPPGNAATDSAPLASTRTLTIQNNTATPDSKVDLTADEVVLRNSAGLNYPARTVSFTIDMGATAGNANALDTGAEAASTWYYVWCIYNGSAVAGLFSASATAPTMPAGYTYKALAGVVRNDGSSNFRRFVTLDRKTFVDQVNVFTAKAAAVADTYEIMAGADLTAFRAAVPPNARTCLGNAGGTSSESSIALAACNADGTVNTNGIGACAVVANSIGSTFETCAAKGTFEVPVRGGAAGYNVQWKSRATTARNHVDITGFTI